MANLTGNPDVVALLLEQHRTVRQLIASVKTADADGRGAAFEPLVRLLAVHETAEEVVVYPALARSAGDEGARVAEARKSEEDAAKKMLADLEDLDPTSAQFMTMFEAFATDVEAHAAAEEGEVFPLLAQTNDAQAMRDLGGDLVAAQKVAPTHAHKSAPEGALANKVVGPLVSAIDRARDLVNDTAGERR
jgi:hemerythrin superfamily protein